MNKQLFLLGTILVGSKAAIQNCPDNAIFLDCNDATLALYSMTISEFEVLTQEDQVDPYGDALNAGYTTCRLPGKYYVSDCTNDCPRIDNEFETTEFYRPMCNDVAWSMFELFDPANPNANQFCKNGHYLKQEDNYANEGSDYGFYQGGLGTDGVMDTHKCVPYSTCDAGKGRVNGDFVTDAYCSPCDTTNDDITQRTFQPDFDSPDACQVVTPCTASQYIVDGGEATASSDFQCLSRRSECDSGQYIDPANQFVAGKTDISCEDIRTECDSGQYIDPNNPSTDGKTDISCLSRRSECDSGQYIDPANTFTDRKTDISCLSRRSECDSGQYIDPANQFVAGKTDISCEDIRTECDSGQYIDPNNPSTDGKNRHLVSFTPVRV